MTPNTIGDAVSPSVEDAKLAQESSRRLSRFARQEHVTLTVTDAGRETEMIELPKPVFSMLLRILTEMAEGNAITLMPINAELTTQQAASILGVSRPFLVQQMTDKKIPYWHVGTHRRVRLKDLMDYKSRIDADRVKVLEQLAAQAQDLNMGY
jgi:excisionase family DNA binding protein